MTGGIETLNHTNDEALRGYGEHLQRIEAEAAARALALTRETSVIVLDETQRDEPYEHTGFGD